MAQEIKGNQENKEVETEVEELDKEKKTYSEEDISRIVDSKISKLRNKWEKEREVENKNAKKMREMDDEERKAYELDQAKAEIEKLKSERAMDANRVEALKIMETRNVPASLVDFIVTADQEETRDNIKLFQKAIEGVVNKVLKEKVPGLNPKTGTSPKEVTYAEFLAMTVPQMKELKLNNSDLYEDYMKR